MTVYLAALLIGIVAGSRTMTAPAGVSWAAYLGRLNLSGSWLSFLGSIWTVIIFTVLAAVEYVTDQLPSTPSRTVPVQFGARLVSGSFCGAAIGAGYHAIPGGLIAGLVGTVIGTLGGRALRGKLAAAFKRDPPAAFLEDGLAILGAVIVGVILP